MELVGLSWYVTEKIEGPIRAKLTQQLADHKEEDACPFLIDEACAVHSMRPMACRQFNVFGQVCREGEDAYYTRRQDVLNPLKKFADEAFHIMLPFYGIQKRNERRKAVKAGSIHRTAKVLKNMEWTTLVEKMEAFDDKKNR